MYIGEQYWTRGIQPIENIERRRTVAIGEGLIIWPSQGRNRATPASDCHGQIATSSKWRYPVVAPPGFEPTTHTGLPNWASARVLGSLEHHPCDQATAARSP